MPNLPETNEVPLLALNGEVATAQLKPEAVTEPKLAALAVSVPKATTTLRAVTSNIGSAEIMQPILTGGTIAVGSTQLTPAAKTAYFARAIVPQSGKVKDVSVLNASETGEIKVAIFDTGDAKAGEYTLLAESASVAQGTTSKWQSLGALGELALTAGQHVLLAVEVSTTGKLRGATVGTIQSLELPEGYLPCAGGAKPKLLGKHAYSAFEFKTIKEAELEEPEAAQNVVPTIICRIS